MFLKRLEGRRLKEGYEILSSRKAGSVFLFSSENETNSMSFRSFIFSIKGLPFSAIELGDGDVVAFIA